MKLAALRILRSRYDNFVHFGYSQETTTSTVLEMTFSSIERVRILVIGRRDSLLKYRRADSPQIKALGGVYNSYTMAFAEYGFIHALALGRYAPSGLVRV